MGVFAGDRWIVCVEYRGEREEESLRSGGGGGWGGGRSHNAPRPAGTVPRGAEEECKEAEGGYSCDLSGVKQDKGLLPPRGSH